MKVHVAYFIYGGVLNSLEVFTDEVEANKQADEWRKDARPDEDVVAVEPALVHGVPEPPTETPLEELRLPSPYLKRLKRRDLVSVEQLCLLTRRHLLSLRNIGARCVEEVELALAERGQSLQGEPKSRSVGEN